MLKSKTKQGCIAEWQGYFRWLRDDCHIVTVLKDGLIHVDVDYYDKRVRMVGNP